MAHCGGICGIELDCPNGCGVLCTSDCEDCTQWCEPTTVEESGDPSPGVMVRVTKSNGDVAVRIRVGSKVDKPGAKEPRYTAGTAFRLSFNDISRASLARLLSNMHDRPVQAAQRSDERLSGSAVGTIAELAAKFSLRVG